MVDGDAKIEGLLGMIQVADRPAGSLIELIERLVLFALMSLVACCRIIVDGATAIAAIALRCAAATIIVLGVTMCLTGVISFYPWTSSEFPQGDGGSALPRMEVDSIWTEQSVERSELLRSTCASPYPTTVPLFWRSTSQPGEQRDPSARQP